MDSSGNAKFCQKSKPTALLSDGKWVLPGMPDFGQKGKTIALLLMENASFQKCLIFAEKVSL